MKEFLYLDDVSTLVLDQEKCIGCSLCIGLRCMVGLGLVVRL